MSMKRFQGSISISIDMLIQYMYDISISKYKKKHEIIANNSVASSIYLTER